MDLQKDLHFGAVSLLVSGEVVAELVILKMKKMKG